MQVCFQKNRISAIVNLTVFLDGLVRKDRMNTKKLIIIVGILGILISVSTWIMDFTGLVEPCIYCRNERTLIGLLGILMVLPKHKYITSYLTLVLGFYGAYVASDQLFNNMIDAKVGLMFYLATAALFFILLQLFLLGIYLVKSFTASSAP